MTRANILVSNLWGIQEFTAIEGDGYDSGPIVSMVAVGDPNTLRVVYDSDMLQDGYLYDLDNYKITETTSPFTRLLVLRAVAVSGRLDAVDLVVQDQNAVGYDFLAGAAGPQAPIRDSYGQPLSDGSATFTGQAPAAIAYTGFHVFEGFEAGMGAKTESGWDPDLTPPYLANQNPYPGETDVDTSSAISLDILDDDSGVNEPSVWIKVNGVYGWLLSAQQPGFDVLRTTIAGGFRYHIQPSLDLPPLSDIAMEVYARDLAGIPNVLSTGWSFKTRGGFHVAFLKNQDPAAEEAGVAPNLSWSFDLLDSYDDILPSTLRLYVGGNEVYSGLTQNWAPPYDGYVGRVIDVDGYDGYHIRIDHPDSTSSSRIDIRVVVLDSQGSGLDETYGFWIAPAALQPTMGPYEITLDLPFSGDMDPASLLDASLFRMSGGAYVRLAQVVGPGLLRLWIERMWGEGPYTLMVSPLVSDIHGGHPVGESAFVVPVFQSNAFFSNTTGLLRAWRVNRSVRRDPWRVYFAGERGIDVFDVRLGVRNATRWSQILDQHGVSAMCVIDSADSYGFETGLPPRLENQTPYPEQSGADPDTAILFSVVHGTTSVETLSLAVYVNGGLVFAGASGGWFGGWGGQIAARPEGLDVELFSPAPFAAGSTVFVRVMASDLLGNQLDMTYSFTVAP